MNTTHPTAPASMATHTPTPFSLPLEVHETREGPSIRDSQGERIAEAYTEQGAQAIVRACNSHAQLVAALSAMYCAGFWTADELPTLPDHQRKAIAQARAALTAAQS